MVVPLARLAVLMKGLSFVLRGYRDFLENYPVDVIVFRALKAKRLYTHLASWRLTAPGSTKEGVPGLGR
jgi:hypothetical protein